MGKGTPVEAIPRDEIPEDLSEIRWAVLQKTAHTLGIPLGQKRPQLEDAIHMALGRSVIVVTNVELDDKEMVGGPYITTPSPPPPGHPGPAGGWHKRWLASRP